VLTVASLEDDAPFVELAHRLQMLVCARFLQIVERSRGAVRTVSCVRVSIVVENLIFETERGVAGGRVRRHRLGNVVLDAAIGAGRDLPLERELEVLERVEGHDVPAFEGLPIRCLGNLAAR